VSLSAYASKVGSYPNIHEIRGAGTTIAQTLPEPQGYALHVPDQVNFQERTTLPHHNNNLWISHISKTSCWYCDA
jgi:hypothetical protein